MPSLAEALERESRTVDLEPGDFDRLVSRRDRKQRNRRIGAGVVGVVVALATAMLLARSITRAAIPARPVPPRPAAAGSLAYVLDGDVYVADPDGSNAVKIVDGRSAAECGGDVEEYGIEGPSTLWSPDGRYLAFRRTDCSNPQRWWDVVISDVHGNIVATFPAQGWNVAWSPDSTRVAVWDTWPKTIGIYGVDGVRQTELTMPTGWEPSGDYDPEWMPDGTSLRLHDMEVPIDGSTPRRAFPWSAQYSPDGSHVASFDRGSLIVARRDGSEREDVQRHWAPIDDVVWSPTGDLMAFATGGPADPSPASDLRLLDVSTGSVSVLMRGEQGTELRVIGFSPHGDRVLFSRSSAANGGRASLWSVNVDGSDARLVIAGTVDGEWLSP